MAALTTLTLVQLIAGDDSAIQAMSDADPIVVQALVDVDTLVKKATFISDEMTELAQRYLMAHILSLANQPVGGRGPLSSESIGGVTRSFTLPYLNQKTVLGSTQFGLNFMELRDMTIPKFQVALAPES